MSNNNKKNPPPEEEQKVKIELNPNTNTPAFSNFVHININHDEGEAVLSFFFVDKNVKTEKNEIPGFPVAKIAMTKNHAQKLHNVLGKLLSGKKK